MSYDLVKSIISYTRNNVHVHCGVIAGICSKFNNMSVTLSAFYYALRGA